MSNIYGYAAVKVEDNIYFSCRDDNALYKLNLLNNEISFLKYFSSELITSSLYSRAYYFEKKIFFIPWEAEKVAIVNLNTLNISYLDVVDRETKYEPIMIDNYIFLASVSKGKVLKINMDNDTISEISLEINEQHKLNYNHRRCVFNNGGLLFLPGKDYTQLSLSLSTNRIREKKAPFVLDNYSQYIEWRDKEIYIPFYLSEGIVIKDINENDFHILKIEKEQREVGCVVSILLGNSLLLLPVYGFMAYVIDLESNNIQKIDIKNKYKMDFEDMGFQNIICDKRDKKLFISSDRIPFILKIDRENLLAWEFIQLIYKGNDNRQRIKEIIINQGDKMFCQPRGENKIDRHETIKGFEELFLQLYAKTDDL